MTTPVVLITGCSSGIGLTSAVTFASRGAAVVATMRDLARADRLRAALDAAQVSVDLIQLDVDDERSVADGFALAVARHGTIDVVISNAGVSAEGALEEVSVDAVAQVMNTNFLGTVRLFKAALPHMREAGGGRLIVVSSNAGVFGMPFNDAYCASKFAIEGLVESMYPVMARHGVYVSAVQPGPVVGEFVERTLTADDTASGPYAAMRARFHEVRSGGYDVAQTQHEIAEALWQVANDPAPKPRYQTSEALTRLAAVKLKDVTGERVVGLTRTWIE